MFGNREDRLKNELLQHFDKYIFKAIYRGHMPVDLSHNIGHTLRLKRQFAKYHHFHRDLGDAHQFRFQVVEHNEENYYLYITKNSPL